MALGATGVVEINKGEWIKWDGKRTEVRPLSYGNIKEM